MWIDPLVRTTVYPHINTIGAHQIEPDRLNSCSQPMVVNTLLGAHRYDPVVLAIYMWSDQACRAFDHKRKLSGPYMGIES